MIYRFIGAFTEIDMGRMKLETLGQKVDLDEATAKAVLLGGGEILPDAEYASLSFTSAEEKAYGWAGPRQSAPPEFKAKHEKGRAMCQRLRADLEAGKPLPSVGPQTPPKAAEPPKISEEVKK